MEMVRERAPRARLRAFMFAAGSVFVGLQLDLAVISRLCWLSFRFDAVSL